MYWLDIQEMFRVKKEFFNGLGIELIVFRSDVCETYFCIGGRSVISTEEKLLTAL